MGINLLKHLKKTLFISLVALSISSTVFADTPQKVYSTSDGDPSGVKVTYEYHDESMYKVETCVGYVTDIRLHPGEKITGVIAGDTKQWSVLNSIVAGTSHIYVKPLASNISTDMIVNTSQRSYRFILEAGRGYNPLVAFQFTTEMYQKLAHTRVYKNKDQKQFFDIFTQEKNGKIIDKTMNYKYTTKVKGNIDKSLCPVKIFDDGTRTYIEMSTNKYDLPVLYNVDEMGKKPKLTLVNYRVNGKYFIADRVFKHGRLQYSSKFYIDIFPKEGDK